MSEASGDYFVRSRGRISGPFAVGLLRQRIARGQVARFDDVSVDRVRWTAAGDVEALFPAAVVTPPQPSEAAPAHAHAARPAAVGTRYHYAMNGINVGPVELDVLRAMAQSGALRANDAVWLDGAEVASYASQVPALAALFGARERTPLPRPDRHDDSLNDVTNGLPVVPTYVACAILLLAATLPPLFTTGAGALWWWDIGPSAAAFVGYAALAAVALFVVALAAAGLGRAITCVSLVAIPTLILLGGGLVTARSAESVWTVAMFATAIACALQLGLWHSARSPSRAAAIALGAFTAITALALVLMTVEALGQVVVWNAGTQAVLLLTTLQAATALAAGVLTIVGGAMAAVSRGVRIGALITNWISFGVAGLMLVLGVVGIMAADSALASLTGTLPDLPPAHTIHHWLNFLAVRVGVLIATWAVLCGTATADLLASVRASRLQPE